MFDPDIVFDESFGVLAVVVVVVVVDCCWLPTMDLNLDLSASKASSVACLSFNPPISNANGEGVDDTDGVGDTVFVAVFVTVTKGVDDTVTDGVDDTVFVIVAVVIVAMGFNGCDSALMIFCYVISGAMAVLTVRACNINNKM